MLNLHKSIQLYGSEHTLMTRDLFCSFTTLQLITMIPDKAEECGSTTIVYSF